MTVFSPTPLCPWKNDCFPPTPLLLQVSLENPLRPASSQKLISEGSFSKKVDFCDKREMEVDYNIFCVSDLRALVKDRGLRVYFKLRKADLIRSHDASTRKGTQ